MASYAKENGQEAALPLFNAAPVRFWAAVDVVVTAPLVLPIPALWFIHGVYQFNGLFVEPAFVPEFHGLQLFFVCLAGALGVLRAFVRLIWPIAPLSLADTLGRLWVAGLIALFITRYGLPSILWMFVLTELSGAFHQALNLLRHRAKTGGSERTRTIPESEKS